MFSRIQLIAVAALVAAGSLLGTSLFAEPGEWKGEIVDLDCFLKDDSNKGPDHAACAQKCIESGEPCALLVGKKLFLLMAEGHDGGKPFAKDAGKQVTITGKLLKKGGLTVIQDAVIKK